MASRGHQRYSRSPSPTFSEFSTSTAQDVVNPVSRFSWTTEGSQDTGKTAVHDTDLSAPPSPSPRRPSPPPSPIMTRRRPIPKPDAAINNIKRKPTPAEVKAASPQHTPGKELPLSPPEQESVDLVTALEAELQSLAHRRRNLQKVIQSLTDLQPNDPVVHDLEKRRQDRTKAERFEQEMDDVRSKEHELGLRLHRAWKRREKNVEAPTGLWVRRVTG